jgi:hydroxymethylglutaryl-CoA synthase
MTNGRKVGIEKITAYPCALTVDMRELAEARGVDPAHPLDELLVTARSLNPVWEDPVTMAVNAALSLLDDEDREAIELVIVGSESSVDFGKPMSTYVQRYCGIGENCRNFETKHACYGGTSAVMMAAHWVAAGTSPGKKALVVTTDQSRTHLGKPWEFVLGAGAAAMVISDRPDVLELELEHNGYWTKEIFDTYRPTSKTEVGHADTSLFGYLEGVEGSFAHFREKAGLGDGPFDYGEYFAKNIYHVPFGGMTFRAHRAIMRETSAEKVKASAARADWERKTKPSLRYNAQLGGTYTSATFIALMGLIDGCEDLSPGDRISIHSYGSGSCAEFYSARIGARAREVVAAAKLQQKLDARRRVSIPEYEAIERARAERVDVQSFDLDHVEPAGLYDEFYAGKGRLVLDGVSDWERKYRLA